MRTLLLRLAFSTALVAVLGLTAVAGAAAQVPEGPTLVVSNPSSGDMLTPGALMIQGVAFDPTAMAGTGVDRVSVFLDDRDSGGMHLGDATLGAPNLMTSPEQFADAGWTLVTPALKGSGTDHTLFVYARSSVTGLETETQIPIVIGQNPRSNAPSTFVGNGETGGGAADNGSSDNPPN